MVFDLSFANNTTLSCFFFLLDLHLIHPITELAMSIGIQTEDAKAKIKHTHDTKNLNKWLFTVTYSSTNFSMVLTY